MKRLSKLSKFQKLTRSGALLTCFHIAFSLPYPAEADANSTTNRSVPTESSDIDAELLKLDPQLATPPETESTGKVKKATPSAKGRIQKLTLFDALSKFEAVGVELKELASALEETESAYRRAQFEFWAPEVSLNYSYSAGHTLARYKGTFPDEEKSRERQFSPESNSLTLTLFRYDLYSGGVPSLQLELAAKEYSKSRSDTALAKEQLKRDLIKKYFDAQLAKEAYEAAVRGVEMWKTVKTIYKLQAQKTSKKNSSKNDDDSAIDIEINDAEQKAQDLASEFETAATELNLTIGEPPERKFEYSTELKYTPFKMNLKGVLEQIERSSPQANDLRFKIESQRIRSQLSRIEKLPLANISFSGLNLSYNFSQSTTGAAGKAVAVTAGDSSSSNINLSLGLNFKMNILGPSGLFDNLAREEEEKNIRSLQNLYLTSKRNWVKEGTGLYKRLKDQQKTLARAEKSLSITVSLLDELLERVSGGSNISQFELKESVIGGTDRVIEALVAKKNELEVRLALDSLMGVDTLNFFEGGQK